MSETQHALLSASGAHRWATCPASLRLESALPRRSSKYADEGTAAHEVAAWALSEDKHPSGYPHPHVEVGGVAYPVDADMVRHVDYYRRVVLDYAKGGSLLVEQRVDFSTWIDVEDSFGTSDSVILHDDRIVIVDLKYGMGVKVDAVENEQLMLYALGALYEYEMLGDFQSVVMVICQPRLEHVSEYVLDVTSLKAFALNMQAAARRALDVYEAVDEPGLDKFLPTDKGCRFCGAKATCPALAAEVETETRDLFAGVTVGAQVPEDRLAVAMSKVDMVEGYCKAVRAEVERRLLVGQPVSGFKLVEGRRGARKWASEDEAEKALKSFRLRIEEMYDLSLISPTTAEKVLKDSPRRWAKLQPLIGRSDGKPSVAPDSDKRPALAVSSVTDAFAALAAPVPDDA